MSKYQIFLYIPLITIGNKIIQNLFHGDTYRNLCNHNNTILLEGQPCLHGNHMRRCNLRKYTAKRKNLDELHTGRILTQRVLTNYTFSLQYRHAVFFITAFA
jgi:hypothetical protein